MHGHLDVFGDRRKGESAGVPYPTVIKLSRGENRRFANVGVMTMGLYKVRIEITILFGWERKMEGFSELRVSTITVTAPLNQPINIIDIAKYLPLDEEVIGIKLVYAGGLSRIVRGCAKLSDKDKDFLNQVTITVRLRVDPDPVKSVIASCKVFHNGKVHITGSHSRPEAATVANLLVTRFMRLRVSRMIDMRPDLPFLASLDNIIFSSAGEMIGWHHLEKIYLHKHFVEVETLTVSDTNYPVFVSRKWIEQAKCIFTLDGELIGEKRLSVKNNMVRRSFEVKFGMVYYNNRIIGTEQVTLKDDAARILNSSKVYRDAIHQNHLLPHFGRATHGDLELKLVDESEFTVCMINKYFHAPFSVNREKLHKTFLENGYYSRFDTCSNAAVNLRFHYIYAQGPKNDGRRPHPHPRACHCRDISVCIFQPGVMNIVGLLDNEQGQVVHNFLIKFFLEHRKSIKSD